MIFIGLNSFKNNSDAINDKNIQLINLIFVTVYDTIVKTKSLKIIFFKEILL